MISSKKISLGQIAKLVKGVSWQDDKLTFSFNEGSDVIANLQDFFKVKQPLTSSDDVDEIFDVGIYPTSWGSTPQNLPVTNNGGTLIVLKDNQPIQLYLDAYNGNVYLRRANSGTYSANWSKQATESWVNAQNFAKISQLFSGNYNDLSNKPSLYNDWKLWTNGSQKTSIGSGAKVDFQAGTNIHIAYSAGGVVTISVTGLQMSDIAGLVSELQKYASDINALELLAHSHDNKAILDGITQQDITNWNTNNATGKVDKSGDTMTGSLMFSQGSSPVVSLSSSAQVVFTALKASAPSWSFYQIINYNGNGDFESCVFHLSNPSKSLLTIGLIGIGVGVDPTESIDAKGTARLREVPNGTGDFARIDSTGVLKKRTLQETKTDLGLNTSVQSFGPIDFSSGQKVIYTATPGEVDVVLPPPAEAGDMGELEITTSESNNLFFKEQGDEGLEAVQVRDIHNATIITEYAGSVRLACVGGEWYKLGA